MKPAVFVLQDEKGIGNRQRLKNDRKGVNLAERGRLTNQSPPWWALVLQRSFGHGRLLSAMDAIGLGRVQCVDDLQQTAQ